MATQIAITLVTSPLAINQGTQLNSFDSMMNEASLLASAYQINK